MSRAAQIGILTSVLLVAAGDAAPGNTMAVGSTGAGDACAATARPPICRLVIEEAERLDVPPALALAIAQAESNFDHLARSSKGARGVMQVMPATVRGEYALDPRILWRPRYNIRIGLHFFRRLLERYQGHVDYALSYYNGGSRVGDLPDARVIPATRGYVEKVKRLRAQYARDLERDGLTAWIPARPLPGSSKLAKGRG